MILIDPTEASSASRLSESVINAAVVCPGLEAVTGADILLSAISTPKIESLSNYNKPTQICLRKHLDAGMLIQRKETDLVSSVPILKETLDRMLAMNPKYGCWLLFVGTLSQDKDGGPLINGNPSYGNMSLGTIMMSFPKWQLRGGYVEKLSSEDLVPMWIRETMTLIKNIEANPEVIIDIRKPVQTIIGDNKIDRPWRRTLMTLPDFGPAKVKAITDYCGDNLIDAVSYITDPTNYHKDNHPPRVGFNDFQAAARWFGLKPGETIVVSDEESKKLWQEYREDNPEVVKIDSEKPVNPPWD